MEGTGSNASFLFLAFFTHFFTTAMAVLLEYLDPLLHTFVFAVTW